MRVRGQKSEVRGQIRTVSILISVICYLLSGASANAQAFDEALAIAYETNPDLNAARAQLRGVDEQVPQALSNYRPQVSASGSSSQQYLYTHPSQVGGVAAPQTGSGVGNQNVPQALIPPGHQALQPYSYGLQITQPIYRGGRTYSDTSRARNTVLAGRAQLAQTEQTVFLNGGTAYLDVVRDQRITNLQIANDQTLSKLATAFKNRLNVGEITRTDVAQAEAQRGQSLSSRVLAQNQLATSRAAFQRYIGIMPENPTQPGLPYQLPATLEEASELAERLNPQVMNAVYTEAAARDQIDLNNGAGLPELDLIGQAGQTREGYTGSPPIANGTIEAQLNIPIYSGGLVSSQTRQAKEVASQRLIEIETNKRLARQQAVQAWQTLEATGSAIDIQREAVKAANEAYKGAREEERVGTKTTLDLLSTIQVQLSAEVGLADTEHDRLLAKLNLLSAIGQLTAEGLHLPVDGYDPNAHYERVHDSWGGPDAEPETP